MAPPESFEVLVFHPTKIVAEKGPPPMKKEKIYGKFFRAEPTHSP